MKISELNEIQKPELEIKKLKEIKKISSYISITDSPWERCIDYSKEKYVSLQRITLRFDKEKYMNLIEMLSKGNNGEEKLRIISNKINSFL